MLAVPLVQELLPLRETCARSVHDDLIDGGVGECDGEE